MHGRIVNQLPTLLQMFLLNPSTMPMTLLYRLWHICGQHSHGRVPDDSKWYWEHAIHIYNHDLSFLPLQSQLTLHVPKDPNLDQMAQSWRFAVTFAQEYNKTMLKGAVGSLLFCSWWNGADNMDRASWTNQCWKSPSWGPYIMEPPGCLAPSKQYMSWIYMVKGGVILPLKLLRK